MIIIYNNHCDNHMIIGKNLKNVILRLNCDKVRLNCDKVHHNCDEVHHCMFLGDCTIAVYVFMKLVWEVQYSQNWIGPNEL